MSYLRKVSNYRNLAASCLLLATITGFFFDKSAQASSYSVGPLVTIVPLDRSQARATINVINPGDQPVRVRIYVEDFNYERNAGFTISPSHPYSAKQYLQFSPREIVVPPKVTRNVRVNILIPASAPDGEYRAVVFAEELSDNSKPQTESTVVVNFRIGSVFFVTKGSGQTDLSPLGIEWNPSTGRPRLLVSNKGSISTNPAMQWKIERDAKEVDSGSLLSFIVQNRSERAINLETKKGKLSSGDYTVSGQIQRAKAAPIPFSFKLKVP